MSHKDPIKVAMGKKSKAQGAAFELRTRKDLTKKGWIVDKWGNNVEFEEIELEILDSLIPIRDMSPCSFGGHIGKGLTPSRIHPEPKTVGKLIQAKNKWAGPGRPMMMGAGFPDFVCFRMGDGTELIPNGNFEVIGIECKVNGTLSKIEKEKCKWILDNHIFSKILIASKEKIKNRIHVKYIDFENA